MKKCFIVALALAFACAGTVVGVKKIGNSSNENNFLQENVEALCDGENEDPCSYKNGYTAFTGKKGGAYDCCRVWVSNAPKNEHCR